jgi:hypothetical protein
VADMLIRVLNGLLSGLKTLFYIAFGVAVVLFFGGFVLHLWQGAGWYKPSVKNTDYIFEVENYRFLIPRNYMWSYSKIRDGFVYEPNLHSLYPNFEPMNESNEKIFKSIGHGGGRKVVFHFKSQKNSKTVDQIIKEGLSNYTLSEKNHSDNLEIYDSDTKGYEFIIIRSGSLVQYFNCTKYDYVPYPSCSTRLNFSPEVMILVNFPRPLLDDWVNIRSGLVQLVTGFNTAYEKATAMQSEYRYE